MMALRPVPRSYAVQLLRQSAPGRRPERVAAARQTPLAATPLHWPGTADVIPPPGAGGPLSAMGYAEAASAGFGWRDRRPRRGRG